MIDVEPCPSRGALVRRAKRALPRCRGNVPETGILVVILGEGEGEREGKKMGKKNRKSKKNGA